MNTDQTARTVPYTSIAILLATALTFSVTPGTAHASDPTSAATEEDAVRDLEGTWRVQSGASSDYVRFGANHVLTWYAYEKDECVSSRHTYRLQGDRFLATPALPDGRSWWQMKQETNSRIRFLERRVGDNGEQLSKRLFLMRAALPQRDEPCAPRERN